ncbi:MAG: hypothetical protein ACODAB_01495 [Gemmatimonadota bacterium]
MPKHTSLLAAFALLVAVPSAALAQDIAALCADIEQAEAGDWAEYETTTPQGTSTMRMALLADGAADDPGEWFEISADVNGQASTVQVLAEAWPYTPDDVQAVVVKMGEEPAMRVSDQMLGQMRNQMATPMGQLAMVCPESELVESESVETPAGTFDTYRIRPPAPTPEAEATVWLSTDVPFGIVRSEGDGGSMVLLAHGDDATSTITETPGDMPMGGMGAP